jgi:hypothetical protein
LGSAFFDGAISARERVAKTGRNPLIDKRTVDKIP